MKQPCELYRALVSPSDAALLIIDHQISFSACYDKSALGSAQDGIAALAGRASTLGVPVVVSMIETNVIKAEMPPELDSALKGAIVVRRSRLNPWEDPAFREVVKALDRPRLLVAGLSAEISMSFTVLSALEEGFDTYAVKDATLGHSTATFAVAFERMVQAGAVPVSWRQLVLEWNRELADASALYKILGRGAM